MIFDFTKQFNVILCKANVNKGNFHDLRKTAITNWFRQGLSEFDIMKLAGHSYFATTHKFYLAVAEDLVDRARQAISHKVSQDLLQRCYQNNHNYTNQ